MSQVGQQQEDMFLVIFKVLGKDIELWPKDRRETSIGKTHSFRISCHNVETHSDHPGSDIQVFLLTEPAPIVDSCTFEYQQPTGQLVNSNDLAIFMTGPVAASRKASYAIDVGVSKHSASSIENLNSEDEAENDFERVGTAYLHIDPKFSSQGVQRTPIIATKNHVPIGQVQIDYLIITNPVGYGQQGARPDWLSHDDQLDAGHRGSGSGRRMDLPEELLENTVASFNYAHRHGADMCELDVVLSADGIPVVYHDFDVDAVATQQSSEGLGKLRIQVSEFTVEQLRDFRLLALKDGKGVPYTVNISNQDESNKPFPTLAAVLEEVDDSCALNIELKWPQMLESGKMEARKCREINDFVERVISVIDKHASGRSIGKGGAAILYSTLNANIAMLLRLKQSKYPVLFLTTGDSKRFKDPTTKSIENAIHFAQAFDLAGINPNAAKLTKNHVRSAQDRDLLIFAWGKIESSEAINELKQTGINGVIYDRIDLIKPQN